MISKLTISFTDVSKLLLICQIISQVLSGKCPPEEVSDPCVCEQQTIRCEGNQSIDLKSLFNNISKSLTKDEKNFQFFVLNNNGIKRLENNTFKDITFRFVTIIDVQSLQTIDPNAFDGTSEMIETFEMSGENSLKDMSQLFRVLNSFKNVISMTLNIYGLESLPSYAFYGLKRLQDLTLTNTQLSHLSDNCLHFETNSDQSLIIDLSDNNLTEFSFERNSLLGVKRPLELDLRDNKLTFLEKNIFKPFLLSDINNAINLSANPLNCSDCRLQWLVEDKHIFESNVLEARCAHFVSVFELDQNGFQHCPS